MKLTSKTLEINKSLYPIYKKLLNEFGTQHWWPAKTKFEVIIGAILTQNTSWQNVEKAILNLKRKKLLNPKNIRDVDIATLAGHIKPSGYYNIKAKRIKNFVNWFHINFDSSISRMSKAPLYDLRKGLLSVNGIGPETADSILLYAVQKPVFVVDAYTRRIFFRHKLISQDASYEQIQSFFQNSLATDTELFNEYHALIVKLAKTYCKKTPECNRCPLVDFKQ